MRRLIFAFLPLAMIVAAPAYAQTASDKVAPTIPETQIEPAELSSDYEFLAAATSADQFIIDAAALAQANAESADVKAIAQELSDTHTASMSAAMDAGKADEIEIAEPSVDGEQQGLLGRLEALKGAEFDSAYVESQLFVHQRAIAYYRGYADAGNNLATFASETAPQLVTQYNALVALADAVGIGEAAQTPVQK